MSKIINIAIIEDEIPAARLLSTMIQKLRPNWVITVLQGSIEEAIEWFETNEHPDIIFLDIQLSDGNSFDFLVHARPSSVIIFTTAYDQYAIRAFNVNSIDYILKPIEEDRLRESIEKYELLIGNSIDESDRIDNLIEALQSKGKRYRTRFLVEGNDRFKPLSIEDIAYFYSENKITFAVTNTNQEYVIDLSLNKLGEQLDPDRFYRANRQMIICINAVVKVEPYFNGKISVTLQPSYGKAVTISQEKVSSFKFWLNY